MKKHEIFGIHRTTLLVLAVAITFGSFSVYKALGVGRTERSEVPAAASPVSGTMLVAGDAAGTGTNPQASAMRLTSATRPAVKTTLTPIEQIQVGDRVLAESPTGEEDTTFGSEIIPSDWRKLTLRAPKRDGTAAEVVLLRSLTWLNEQHGEVGGTVFISVPECGIDGNAQVLGIDPCPEILSGSGRVVTGTFLHQARSTITLTIAGQTEPIECTGNHPFWSEDRQTFVRADSLQPNETLRTATGLTTVESWTPDLNPTPVYNIEVHGAHVYHVGTSGVVVHNGNVDDCWVTFAHGTSPEYAKSIMKALDEAEAKAASLGGKLNRPGSFHTHLIGPPGAPGDGLSLAYQWGLRQSESPVVLIGRISKGDFDDLLSRNLILVENIGAGLPQVVFSPDAFSFLNDSVEWLQVLRP